MAVAEGVGETVGGVCHVMLAFDVALSIDLAAAEELLRDQATRPNISQRFRAPEFISYEPAPLRVSQACQGVAVGGWSAAGHADVTLFDFGAASVVYRIPFSGPLERAAELSDALTEHEGLREDARARVLGLCAAIGPALQRPRLGAQVEDYAVFVVDPQGLEAEQVLAGHAELVARMLRGNAARLSEQEVADALGARHSFTRDDAVLVDWSGAVVVDREPADVLAILEFANVELLEMRHLDDRLDTVLAASYETVSKPRWWRRILMGQSRDLRRLAAMQTDAALMFEGVNNAIKLVGDQYLARVYRATATRMGVPEWQASVRRKLATLESISDRVAEHGATVRMEIIEWIIVLLILFEVVMSFL